MGLNRRQVPQQVVDDEDANGDVNGGGCDADVNTNVLQLILEIVIRHCRDNYFWLCQSKHEEKYLLYKRVG